MTAFSTVSSNRLPRSLPRGAAVALLLFGMLLAGCSGATETSTTTPPPPAPAVAFKFNVTEVDRTLDVSEPSIMTGTDGTLWISGPTGFAKAVVRRDPSPLAHDTSMLKSTDGGATWQNVVQIPMYGRDTCAGGGDSDLSTAPDGALFLVDLNLANAPVDVSYDNGQTWLFNCNSSIQPGIDRQWIASTTKYVWVSVNGLTGGPIVYRAQRDLLPTEGTPVDTSLLFGPPVNVPVGGAIVVDQATGILYLAGSGREVAISTDNGDSFQSVETGLAAEGIDLSNSFISIDVDLAGNVFVAGAGTNGVWVSGSSDHGKTWTSALNIAPYTSSKEPETDGGGEYQFAWVAAAGNGTVGVAWYGWPSANETGPFKTETPGYYVFASQTLDLLENGANASYVTTIVTPKPVSVKRLCIGLTLPTFTQCDQADPSKTRSLGDFFETGYDNDGHMLITFVDATHDPPNSLMFAKQTAGTFAAPGWH